jgi:hypothetical protein
VDIYTEAILLNPGTGKYTVLWTVVFVTCTCCVHIFYVVSQRLHGTRFMNGGNEAAVTCLLNCLWDQDFLNLGTNVFTTFAVFVM